MSLQQCVTLWETKMRQTYSVWTTEQGRKIKAGKSMQSFVKKTKTVLTEAL